MSCLDYVKHNNTLPFSPSSCFSFPDTNSTHTHEYTQRVWGSGVTMCPQLPSSLSKKENETVMVPQQQPQHAGNQMQLPLEAERKDSLRCSRFLTFRSQESTSLASDGADVKVVLKAKGPERCTSQWNINADCYGS